nr:phage tail protein [Tabrizicola sp.]
ANYPDPTKSWESSEATPYYNATHEAADRNFRLTADLNLVACPYPAQVRRLQYSYVEEERRFRRHTVTLPPDAAVLEPLDAVGWTSPWNGYTTKVFEVDQVGEDVLTGLQRVMLKEREAADFSYPGLPAPASISILPIIPTAQIVPNFAVTPTSIPDASGIARRPALRLTWEPDLADVRGIMFEVRVQATGVVVYRGSTQDVASAAFIVTEGLIASTAYQVRAQPVVDRPATWTAWIAATTPANLFIRPDLAVGSVTDRFESYVPGPFFAFQTPPGFVFFTYNHGEMRRAEVWRSAIGFDLAAPIASDLPANRVLLLYQVSIKPFNLNPEPFRTLATLNSQYVHEYGVGGYIPVANHNTFAGVYENVQFRLFVSQMPGGASNAFPYIRDVSFVMAEQTR